MGLDAELVHKDSTAYLTLRLIDPPEDDILKSVSAGFRSEIVYTVQLLRRSVGFLGLMNEELLQEKTLVSQASWDRFDAEYQINPPDGGQVSISNPGIFLKIFHQLVSFPLDWAPNSTTAVPNLLKVRAELTPIKLVSPLNLMTLFTSAHRLQTPWKVLDFPGANKP